MARIPSNLCVVSVFSKRIEVLKQLATTNSSKARSAFQYSLNESRFLSWPLIHSRTAIYYVSVFSKRIEVLKPFVCQWWTIDHDVSVFSKRIEVLKHVALHCYRGR